MIRKLTFLLTVSSLFVGIALSQEVLVRRGNLFFTDSTGETRQLTTSGHDTLAVLSPQSNIVAFVRLHHAGSKDAQGLWVIRTDGTGLRRILTESANDDPKQNLTGFVDLQFSLDAKKLYFSAEGWATSFAVHEVDLATMQTRFITDGGLHSIVPRGDYKGYLIVGKHRYFVGGGSYDWYWVVDPATGKDVGPLGESTDYFYKMLKE